MNIKIQFSEKFSNYIEKFKDNKVIKVLISLRDTGIAKENLLPNDTYVDFINIKEDQSISYIKVASIAKNSVTDPWHKSRQHCSITQLLNRIVSNQHYQDLQRNNIFKQSDIEELSALIVADNMKDFKLEYLRGFNVLEAYNYTGKVDVKKINSCANFRQPKESGWIEPKISWFRPYIDNDCAIIVIKDKAGLIRARAAYFEGIQQEDSGSLKKGDKIKMLNNIFSEHQSYSQLILNHCKANGIIQYSTGDNIIIPFKTKCKNWAPVDNLVVDVENGILANRYPNFKNEAGTLKYKVQSTYKLLKTGGDHTKADKNRVKALVEEILK